MTLPELPPRITTSEVLAQARYGVKKLWQERRAGRMPEPIGRGKEDIYDRDQVLKALGIIQDDQPPTASDDWNVDPDAIRDARSRKIRHPARTAGGRNASGVLPGPRTAKAPRLAVVNAAPVHGRPAR